MALSSQDCYFSDISEGEVNRLIQESGQPGPMPIFNSHDWAKASGTVKQTATHVATSAFAGDYNFRISVDEPSNRTSYSYSTKLNRLYIDWNKAVPIKFHWDGPVMLNIRAMLVFKEPDCEKEAVLRCRIHSDVNDRSNEGYMHVGHVLRCDNENSLYGVHEKSNRHSVMIFLDNVADGTGPVSLNYRFMCKTSCVGGLNRNKTDVVFTLEDNNYHVWGRAVMGVKICSCPRRDKGKDEEPVPGKKRRHDSSHQRPEAPLQNFLPFTVKEEVEPENGALVDYRVRVPQSRAAEFEDMVSRWLYVREVPQEVVYNATAGSVMKM